MSYVRIIGTNHCYHSESEPEEYGSWSENYDHDISGFKVVKSKEYFDLVLDFEPEKDVPYYLVYATYGTGNSFGSSSGHVSYVHLFKSVELARECIKAIQKSYDRYDQRGIAWKEKNSLTTRYTLDSGKIIEENVDIHPWIGYFERLESIQYKIIEME